MRVYIYIYINIHREREGNDGAMINPCRGI